MIFRELLSLPALSRGAAMVAALLMMRLFPPVVAMTTSGRSSWSGRAVVAAGFCALVAASSALGNPFPWLPVTTGAAYLLLMATLIHRLGRMHARGEVARFECALLPIVGFIVVPAILVPQEMRPLFLVMGFDAALSSYSYCIEVRRVPAQAHGVKDCLFFLLVNPTLVYVKRGRRVGKAIAWHGPGMRRMALGVAVLFVADAFLVPLYQRLAELEALGLVYRVLTIVSIFVAQYAMHSGLASVQIGLLRQAGHELPERYNKPFLARNPVDFWRRWNTYVGAWVERYLFFPAAIRLGRVRLGRHRTNVPAQATAIMLSFIAMGIMHDAFDFARSRVVHSRATGIFAIAGAMVLAWVMLERSGILQRTESRLGNAAARWLVPVTGRVVFVGTIMFMIAAG